MPHITAHKRVVWIDLAKVLSMFLVVWFHVPSALEANVRSIEYVVVNIPFFVLAGMTFSFSHKRMPQWQDFLSKTCRGLIVPTIVFFLIFYALWIAVGRSLAGDTEPWYLPLKELATGHLVTVQATYWFVICLCSMQAIFYAASKCLKNTRGTLLVCTSLSFLPLLCDVPSYFELSQALTSLPFFCLGYSLYGRRADSLMVCGITLVMLLCYTALGGRTYVVGVALALLLCMAIAYISISLTRRGIGAGKGVRFLCSGALVILALQNNIIGVCNVALSHLTHSDAFLAEHIWCKLLVILFVYACSVPCIYVITKHLPWVLGKRR